MTTAAFKVGMLCDVFQVITFGIWKLLITCSIILWNSFRNLNGYPY